VFERLDWRWCAAAGASLLLTALLSFSQAISSQHRQLLDSLHERGVFTLSRASVLDGALGERIVVPRAFDFSTAQMILGSEAGGPVFGPVRRSIVHAWMPDGDVERIVLLESSRRLGEFLSGTSGCNPDVGHWAGADPPSGRLRHTAGDLLIKPAQQSALLRELAGAAEMPVVLVCSGSDWFDSTEVVVVPSVPDAGVTFSRVVAVLQSEQRADSIFGNVVTEAEMLSARLAEDLQQRLGWMEQLRPLASALQIGVLFAFGIFLAATRLGEIQTYRSLGASIRFIALRHAFGAASALLPAMVLVLATSVWIGLDAGPASAVGALGYMLALHVTALLAFLVAFFLVVLWRIDTRLALRTSATHGIWNTRLAGASLGGMVALLAPFAAFAWLATAELEALEDLDLGYSTEDLWVIRAVPIDGGKGGDAFALSVSERLVRSGERVAMICSEPWLDFRMQAAEGGASGVLYFASARIADTLGLRLEGRDFSLADMANVRVSLVQPILPVHLRHAEMIATPVGTFTGFRVGASVPEVRFVMFRPLAGSSCANTPSIVMRSESRRAAALAFAKIEADFRDYRLSFPLRVTELIDGQRRDLLALRDAALVLLLIGIGVLGLACVMIAASYARFSRRVLAIRLAIGESPPAAAWQMTWRSSAWIGIGILLGLLFSMFLREGLGAALPRADDAAFAEALLAFPAVAVASILGVFASCLWMVNRLPVASLLREE